MKVAKIRIEAPVASFRYPHFLIGRQASFDMPPPSTIYGHIASAIGELFDPVSVHFAYHFSFQSRCRDLEHQHIIRKGKGVREWAGQKYPVAVEGGVQPCWRDFLFDCCLTLYLHPPEMAEAFRHPAFCVILGRSQDLAKIASVKVIELVKAKGAYLEHTLLPFSMRPLLGCGVAILMPCYIEPPPERQPHFSRFIVLHNLIFAGEVDHSNRLLSFEGVSPWAKGVPEGWLIDPESPLKQGVHWAAIFHSFVGENGGAMV